MPNVTLNLSPTWQIPPIVLTSNEQNPVQLVPTMSPITISNNQGAATNVALQALLQGPPGQPYLGNEPYTATISGGVVTENLDGQEITTTFNGGTITAVYGAPISQTWKTIISGGTIVTSRSA